MRVMSFRTLASAEFSWPWVSARTGVVPRTPSTRIVDSAMSRRASGAGRGLDIRSIPYLIEGRIVKHAKGGVRNPSVQPFHWISAIREGPLRGGLRPLAEGFGQAEVPSDDPPHDLAGPFADLQDLRVAVVARHRELFHVAIPPVDLDGIAGSRHGSLTRIQLGQGRFHLVRATLVLQPGCT